MKQATFIFEVILNDKDTVLVRNAQNGQVMVVDHSVIGAADQLCELVEDFRKFDPQADLK